MGFRGFRGFRRLKHVETKLARSLSGPVVGFGCHRCVSKALNPHNAIPSLTPRTQRFQTSASAQTPGPLAALGLAARSGAPSAFPMGVLKFLGA